jgi:hypothetical protein
MKPLTYLIIKGTGFVIPCYTHEEFIKLQVLNPDSLEIHNITL